MSIPTRVVIDTNVLIVANGKASHVGAECALAAIQFLEQVEESCVVVIDSLWHILEEYEKYCSYKGQPGVGDRFFLHLHRTQADVRRVHKVDLHPDGRGSYDEIPVPLRSFDPSDHKFVATVIADERRSVIVNCADSDWREAEALLRQSDITVHEVCGSQQGNDSRPGKRRSSRPARGRA